MLVNVVPRCEVTLKIFALVELINDQKKKPKNLTDKGCRDVQKS